MGMYDTILVPCPRCGDLYEAQTKGGECVLARYDLYSAPLDALGDVNRHAPFTCDKCGVVFYVQLMPQVVAGMPPQSSHLDW
jgi:hypothetical protein